MSELAKCENKDSISISHDKRTLPLQSKKKSGNKNYICVFDDCMKSYGTSTHLRRHEEIHFGNIIKCTEENCGKEFKTRFTLNKHINNIHLKKNPKKYKCSYCDEQSNKHNWLAGHLYNKHNGIRPHKCTYEGCEKRFLVPSKLERHMKIHKGYTCTKENCGKVFPKWTLLMQHKTYFHPTIHKCLKCRKEFSTSYNLKSHSKIHKVKREIFQCPKPDCSKFYMKKCTLDRHIQSFHGKPFVCIQGHCNKTFRSKAAMIAHCSQHDFNTHKRKLYLVGKTLTTKRSDIKYLLRSAKEISYSNPNHVPSSSNQPVKSTKYATQIESRSKSEKVDISSMPVKTETSHGQKNIKTSLLSMPNDRPTLSSVKAEITNNINSQSDFTRDISEIPTLSSVNSSETTSSSNSQNFSGKESRSANTSKLSRCQKSTETSIADNCDEITILPTPAKPQSSVITLDDDENSTLSLTSRISPKDVGLSMSVTRSRPVIPEELPGLLHDLSYAVIKNKPNDIVSFAANYFQQLTKEREKRKQTSGLVPKQ